MTDTRWLCGERSTKMLWARAIDYLWFTALGTKGVCVILRSYFGTGRRLDVEGYNYARGVKLVSSVRGGDYTYERIWFGTMTCHELNGVSDKIFGMCYTQGDHEWLFGD